jgi:hypothetical protein
MPITRTSTFILLTIFLPLAAYAESFPHMRAHPILLQEPLLSIAQQRLEKDNLREKEKVIHSKK